MLNNKLQHTLLIAAQSEWGLSKTSNQPSIFYMIWDLRLSLWRKDLIAGLLVELNTQSPLKR